MAYLPRQRPHRTAPHGVNRVGCNLDQWDQHEVTDQQPRMRNMEIPAILAMLMKVIMLLIRLIPFTRARIRGCHFACLLAVGRLRLHLL